MNGPGPSTPPPKFSVISFLATRRLVKKRDSFAPVTLPDEQRMAILISRILRAGVLLSAALVAFGGMIYLARHGEALPLYHGFAGEPLQLRTFSGILSSAMALSGRGIIQLGLLVLLATPIARVAVAFIGFCLIYDKLYIVVAALVLSILIVGFLNLPA